MRQTGQDSGVMRARAVRACFGMLAASAILILDNQKMLEEKPWL